MDVNSKSDNGTNGNGGGRAPEGDAAYVPPVAGSPVSLADRLASGREASRSTRPNGNNAKSGADAFPPTNDPATSKAEPRRISPRSPRLALEPEKVPGPTRRSKRVRHPVVIAGNAVFTFLVLLILAVGGGLFFGKARFEAPGPLAEEKTVIIPRGLGTREIADLLQREGVIDQPWIFMGGVVVMKAREGLKYGEYRFAARASLSDVVDTITEGKVVQHNLTLAEGLTSEQIVARLLQNEALAGPIREVPREGTLLPETYKFTRGTSRESVIQRMQQASRKLWLKRGRNAQKDCR